MFKLANKFYANPRTLIFFNLKSSTLLIITDSDDCDSLFIWCTFHSQATIPQVSKYYIGLPIKDDTLFCLMLPQNMLGCPKVNLGFSAESYGKS